MYWSVDPESPEPLRSQIAACVRRAVAGGDLAEGDRLPPAAELGEALGVDRNTVLSAYRILRADGLLEFRRGRGVRVAAGAAVAAPVEEAAERLVALARTHGYPRAELVRLIERLA
ncbi:MAG: GntR family transcriptional regulator [Thermoleophilia bacterium]